MKRLRVGFVLFVGASAALAVPVLGAPGGRVDLDVPMRVIDTRDGGGERITSLAIGSGVLQVYVVDPSASGTATVHPCADGPGDDVTFRLDPEQPTQQTRVVTAEQACLTATVPVHVIVDGSGTVTPTPEIGRRQYVALPQPVELFDDATTRREQIVRIPRPAQVGDGSDAVVSVEVLTATGPGYVRVRGCSSIPLQVADLPYRVNRVANVAFAPLEPDEDLCVFVLTPAHVRIKLLGELALDGPDPAALPPSWRYTPAEVPAPSLRPITPERILDTRNGLGRTGTSPVAPDEVVEVEFGELVGPLTTAVVLNVTVTQPDRLGFLTAWPCGGDRPVVSNLNFEPGETVPNLVVSKLGPAGTICLSGIANAHVIADLSGTYEADGGLLAVPVAPTRILDTRIGLGGESRLSAGEVIELQVVGNDEVEVPAAAGAATLNVTATGAAGLGYLTVYPCDADRPETSNVNYAPGQSIPNLVTTKLAAAGSVCIFSLTPVDVVVDLAAWFGVDQPAGLVELAPKRILDTRSGLGAPTGKVDAGTFIEVQVAGRGGVADDADAVVVNLTVTEPEVPGFLTAWPCDRSMPVVSNVNYGAGETNPNLATVKLAADGTLCIYSLSNAHVLADVAGYVTDETVQGQQLVLG
jgi:hypothetical protein